MAHSLLDLNRLWSRLDGAVAAPRDALPTPLIRRAKSGEPLEHANTVHPLDGAAFVDAAATYRGHGLAL
jgi:hypothetical protein